MKKQLLTIHAELGIPANYEFTCKMPLQAECQSLVEVAPDVFDRKAVLETQTAAAWERLQAAAIKTGITLQLVSAYRSYEYQKQIFLRKIERGESLADILQVNAAPGYSEHHSGRALDIGCPGFPYLEESFEQSPAFSWLQKYAADFGFRLSFPRNNEHSVLYEPWHWCFCGVEQLAEE